MPIRPWACLRTQCHSTCGSGHGGRLELLRWLWCEPKPSGGSPAMTDSHTTPEAAILVAVDIAKDHNELLIELRARRDRHRRFRVANTLEEYKRLVAYLRQLDAPALIGFEAT